MCACVCSRSSCHPGLYQGKKEELPDEEGSFFLYLIQNFRCTFFLYIARFFKWILSSCVS